MTFDIIDADQRSPEWFQARLGRLTGSRAADMLATIKTGEAAARRDLRMQLVCERLTGQAQEESFVNAAMQRGVDLEPIARDAYERQTGRFVQATGFLAHRTLMAGCSLDGHVGDWEGIVEVKCPKSATHLRYVRSAALPVEHVPQVLHNLWITGAEWCDFISFDDRFPVPMQLCVVRVMRDEKQIADYAKKATAFLQEVDMDVLSLKTTHAPATVLREVVA